MAQLVGVHGIGHQHSGRHQLLRVWAPALADGLERAAGRRLPVPALDIAFYGDLFHPAPTSSIKAADVTDNFSADELQAILDDVRAAVGDAEFSRAMAESDKGYSRTPLLVQAVLRAIDRRFGAAAGVLYLGVLRQVYRYLTDPQLKAAVDEQVAATVSDECQVLVGHSLGSVVAYEYFRRNTDHNVGLFLTIGSPLGLRMVMSRLVVGGIGATPWVNLRDPRDPVTCAGDLSDSWPGVNDMIVDNGSAAHDAQRYLGKRLAGEAILSALPELTGQHG